jgi:hypothetical protein
MRQAIRVDEWLAIVSLVLRNHALLQSPGVSSPRSRRLLTVDRESARPPAHNHRDQRALH